MCHRPPEVPAVILFIAESPCDSGLQTHPTGLPVTFKLSPEGTIILPRSLI